MEGWWKKPQVSQEASHKGPAMDLGLMENYSLWASAQGSSWMCISGIKGETEVSGIRVNAGDSFLMDNAPEDRQQHSPLSELSP